MSSFTQNPNKVWQVKIPSTVVPKDEYERALFIKNVSNVSKTTNDPTILTMSVNDYVHDRNELNKGDGITLS